MRCFIVKFNFDGEYVDEIYYLSSMVALYRRLKSEGTFQYVVCIHEFIRKLKYSNKN